MLLLRCTVSSWVFYEPTVFKFPILWDVYNYSCHVWGRRKGNGTDDKLPMYVPPCSYFITTPGITEPSWYFPTDLKDPTQHSVLRHC